MNFLASEGGKSVADSVDFTQPGELVNQEQNRGVLPLGSALKCFQN